MTDQDITRIERALAIRLPEQYASFMGSLDAESLVGNSDSYLWDDADALIQRNLELRSGIGVPGATPWPDNLFFIGDPLTACAYAIDLDTPRLPVHWIDHCDLDAGSSGQIADSFIEWATSYVDENS